MDAWVQPGWRLVCDSLLCELEESLTLCPSHPLLPECTKGVGRHLVRNDIHVVYSLLATAVCSQCRVDVLGQHVAVHLEVADNIRAPPAIAAAEQSELEHPASAWVCNGVDLVKLDGDQPRKEGLVCVVYDTAALHDVRLFLEEAFGRPSDVVRVWAVVCVEDAGVV
jgi:hypothetical protein